MAIRFTATLNAFNRGIESMKTGTAVQMIEDWETALSDIDVPGAKGIARDLAALRRQLEGAAPDAERIMVLIGRLGDATTRIAARADKSGDRLAELGSALAESGSTQDDEAHDEVAAATPKRRSKAA